MTGLSQRPGDWIVGWAAFICGAIGLVTGLVWGLTVYVPTAWAAAFEVGIPAAVLGVVIGLGIVGVRGIVRWIRARSA
ncbi:MAG TPA: hypothetical protein VF557_10230 [Jatrophihabitans sp.]|jgi:tetrahydromethanopterin S-methyltransferase subunit E|uniref:hypothetical protein n=1 Tax=Jatrophihabitans sp. TaxID=1932789 RepID=UPI002EEE0E72